VVNDDDDRDLRSQRQFIVNAATTKTLDLVGSETDCRRPARRPAGRLGGPRWLVRVPESRTAAFMSVVWESVNTIFGGLTLE